MVNRLKSMSGKETDSDTKEKLLQEAKEEFAKKGFAGARMDAIAAKAKLNKGMLYYYFGSKEKLHTAVLKSCFKHIKPQYLDALKQFDSPDKQLYAFLYLLMQLYVIFPDLTSNQILTWEMAKSDRHLHGIINNTLLPFILEITKIVSEGIKENIFIEHDVYIHLTSVVSTIIGFEHRKDFFKNTDLEKLIFTQGYKERFFDFIINTFYKSILAEKNNVPQAVPNTITQKIDDLLMAENVNGDRD